jgi:hypothetical protein
MRGCDYQLVGTQTMLTLLAQRCIIRGLSLGADDK